MRYNLVQGFDAAKFEADINRLLASGWQLHGTTAVVVYPDGDNNALVGYFQALVASSEDA